MKMDLLQVAFLCLKSILGKNVFRDHINAHFVMHVCLSFEFLHFVVEMLQGFTLKFNFAGPAVSPFPVMIKLSFVKNLSHC